MAYLCSTMSHLSWKYLKNRSDEDWRLKWHGRLLAYMCDWARGLKGQDCGQTCLTSHVIYSSSQHGGLRVIKFMWWLQCICSKEQGGNSVAFYDLTLEITWQHFCNCQVATLPPFKERNKDPPLCGKRIKEHHGLFFFFSPNTNS